MSKLGWIVMKGFSSPSFIFDGVVSPNQYVHEVWMRFIFEKLKLLDLFAINSGVCFLNTFLLIKIQVWQKRHEKESKLFVKKVLLVLYFICLLTILWINLKRMLVTKGKEEELTIMKANELGNLHEDSNDLSFVVKQVKSPTTKGKSLRNKRISKVNLPRSNAISRRVRSLHRRYTLT